MDWGDFWDRVSTCPKCHVLVADHELDAHSAWHHPDTRGPIALTSRLGNAVVMLQDGVNRYDVIDYLRTGKNCHCAKCDPTYPYMRICRQCGDKRCPYAADHMNPCNATVEGAARQLGATL